MIQISSILQWVIFIWGLAIFLLLFITAICIYLKTKNDKRALIQRSKLLDEITNYLSTNKITPELAAFRRKKNIVTNLLLDLLEKISGKDYENLCGLIDKLMLRSWIEKRLKSKNPRNLQPALLLVKHLKDKKYLPEIKKAWSGRHTLTRLLSKEVALHIEGPSIIPEVLDSFKNESLTCRIFLIESITEFRENATPFLLDCLSKTDDPLIQIPLIDGLKDLFVISASGDLINLLKTTNHEGVQWTILDFFANISSPIPTNLLFPFLKHHLVAIRYLALIVALRQETDQETIKSILVEKIKDEEWQIRYLALHRWASYFKKDTPPTKDVHLYERVLAEESLNLKTFGEGLERPPL